MFKNESAADCDGEMRMGTSNYVCPFKQLTLFSCSDTNT